VPGTPGTRAVGGGILADGTLQFPAGLFTVVHDTAEHTYSVTLPAGTFLSPPPAGGRVICTFAVIGTATIDSYFVDPIASDGSSSYRVSYTADTAFGFICIQQNAP
jgi:hypothetical protein